MHVPLQLGDLAVTPRTVLFVSEFLSIGLGLVIAYIAFQGYRRNDSRPMLFIAVGFVLVTGLPAVFAGAFLAFAEVGELAAAAATQVSEIIGMLCIIYALRNGK
ncbi:hypothetical protein BRD00_07620 [Halobacteriales archaeon QS_8_69_26]|nr:MAG: hypothetical protein BRD00_07620 [Halobacteriales archaeon QS_8_69_26]